MLLFEKSSGEVWKQCARQLGISELETLDKIRKMGAVYHFLFCLQQPHIYITETRCIIPSSCIDQTTLFELIANRSNSSLDQNRLIRPILSDLINYLNTIYNDISQKERALFRHGLILSRIASKTAEEVQKEGCELLTTSISLTPIRKLWIAWVTNLFIR